MSGDMNRLETCGGAGVAGFGSSETLARVRIDADCFDQANPARFVGEFVAAGFEIFCDVGREIGFEQDCVRKPLLMKPRGVDRGLRVFAEAHPVENCQHRAGNDARAAACAGDEAKLAVAEENRGHHRAERAFARGNRVCFGLNEAVHIRGAGVRSEVVHFVVEEVAVGSGDTRAVEIVESVAIGDGIAGGIDDGEVGCVAVGCRSSEVAIDDIAVSRGGSRARNLGA